MNTSPWYKFIFSLTAKLIALAILGITGIVGLSIVTGKTILEQGDEFSRAVERASTKVAAATAAQVKIIELDRAVQSLIAADEAGAIRVGAIASIRAGAAVDENLANLQEMLGENADVERLVALMADLRPRQLQVIGVARSNDDAAALERAAEIEPALTEIVSLSSKIVSDSQQALQMRVSEARQKSVETLVQTGTYGGIALATGLLIALFAARLLNKRLALMRNTMQAIASGDLTADIPVHGRDEISEVLAAMKHMQQQLADIIERDIYSIIDNAKRGDLNGRIDIAGKTGFFHSLSTSINQLVEISQGMLGDTARVFAALSAGKLDEKITAPYEGQFDQVKRDANTTVDRLHAVLEGELQPIIDSARAGDLSGRVNTGDKQGAFLAFSSGINDLLQINESVVSDTGRVLHALANGDLSQRITADYDGRFNELKRDANATVDELRDCLEQDIQSIINSARRGELQSRVDLTGKEGFFGDLAGGINELVDITDRIVTDAGRVFAALSEGRYDECITGEYEGQFAQLKHDCNETMCKLCGAIEYDIQQIIDGARAGDLSGRVDVGQKEGFFLTLGEGINEVLDINERVNREIANLMEGLANGDLTRSIEGEYQGQFAKLKDDANTAFDRLKESVSKIALAADTVGDASREISSGNINLSQRTEEQSAQLEQTAADMRAMIETVRSNSQHARDAETLSQTASSEAATGQEVVAGAIGAMNDISSSSERIAGIVDMIEEIAFQTNLLALNASVEAARAGDQGRGFAVVATEVRTLAERSSEAAKEIKDLIEESVSRVAEGSRRVDASGETLERISNAVSQLGSYVTSIADASEHQASDIERVNVAVSQMEEATQQNASLVEELAAAAEAMKDQAKDMRDSMSFFTTSEGARTRHLRVV